MNAGSANGELNNHPETPAETSHRGHSLVAAWLAAVAGLAITMACSEGKEHTAAAVRAEDSVAVMVSFGVNSLISDSGVIKYRIVAERWEVNQARDPSLWIFDKGVFMEQFDQKFHVETYIQSDTAYYYDQKKIWELRGRVRVRTSDGLRFWSEELFWNQVKQEFYSHKYSHLVTPERELEGTYFRSDERMSKYTVSNSVGSFVREDEEEETTIADTALVGQDSVEAMPRSHTKPKAKTK